MSSNPVVLCVNPFNCHFLSVDLSSFQFEFSQCLGVSFITLFNIYTKSSNLIQDRESIRTNCSSRCDCILNYYFDLKYSDYALECFSY